MKVLASIVAWLIFAVAVGVAVGVAARLVQMVWGAVL